MIVRDVLEALLSLIRPQATSKGITLDLLPGDANVIVRADEERLDQIVLNLLANAIKFTPTGGHVVGAARRKSRAIPLPRRSRVDIRSAAGKTVRDP